MRTVADKFAGVKALRPAGRRMGETPRGELPQIAEASEQLALLLGATTVRNRYGEHLALRRWFSEPCAFEPHADSLRLLAPNAPKEAQDLERWLFLDTETTGLAGGTGTYAFLVGLAWWDAGGLEVEQFFMREHSEEHSVLLALRERLAERPVLVTFNGKSFDWPLLETRFRMTRAITPRTPIAHLDLLHPARQLWRLRLGTARLPELEKHVLGWERGIDVQSELIPQIYFDFLRGGPAEPLVPIFRHNQMDLRGLAALAARVFSVLAAPEEARCDALELYGVSRILSRRGEYERARELYARTLDAGLSEETGRMAQRELARLAKRGRDYELANSLWEKLCSNAGSEPETIEALVELAIHYEHRGRDPLRAAQMTREALAHLSAGARERRIAAGRYRSLRGNLEHRLERLSRKASRSLPLETISAEARSGPPASNQEV
ncbi:MAG TPA: ribonuclease H-like domain-containing protein [Candidatus Acidoferrales bacterium]|nr:ribonuclease H-like domain-containing protein [Candidatus Acidoferrales bacterium]